MVVTSAQRKKTRWGEADLIAGTALLYKTKEQYQHEKSMQQCTEAQPTPENEQLKLRTIDGRERGTS